MNLLGPAVGFQAHAQGPTTSQRTAQATRALAEIADKDTRGVPKYIRLQEVVVELIQRGAWKRGDRLPTEKELAVLSGLSLGTVQRALRGLVDQGIVVRQQGLATFVAENPRQMQDPWHCRFLNESGSDVLPVYSEATRRHDVKERGPWTDYLGIDHIFRIDRRLRIGDEFTVLGHFYASREVLRLFWDYPLTELNGANFKALITQECRLPITQITHDVRMMKFSPQVRRMLKMNRSASGLLVCATARAGRDTFIYYQEFFIPPTQRLLRFSEKFEGPNSFGAG